MANGHNKPGADLPSTSVEDGFEEEEGDDHVSNEEVASLCATMDQLDSCLDDIERKNDSLNAKLRELLKSMEEEKGSKQAVRNGEEEDHASKTKDRTEKDPDSNKKK